MGKQREKRIRWTTSRRSLDKGLKTLRESRCAAKGSPKDLLPGGAGLMVKDALAHGAGVEADPISLL